MFRMSAQGRIVIAVLALDALTPLVAIGWYGGLQTGSPAGLFLRYPWLVLTALTFPLALAVAELYTPRNTWLSAATAARAAAAAVAAVLLFGVAHALTGERRDLPGLFGTLAAAMATVAAGSRIVLGLRMRSGPAVRRALVVGAGWAGGQVIDCTLFEPRLRVRIVGAIDDDPLKRNVQYKGVAVVGTGADLAEAATRHDIDLVVVAIPRAQGAELAENLVRLALRGVEIMDMPGFVERVTGQVPIRSAEGAWLVYGGGFDALKHPWRQRLKRGFDVAVAAGALLLALPVLAAVALAVKLASRGPVLFHVERAGRGGSPIRLAKFRTMEEAPEVGADAGAPAPASRRSYRMTGIGRLLRRTRLDEVPQLFNVLRGDLSFVGPRLERHAAAARHGREIPFYALRFAVRPGLTGWAQVQQRSGAPSEEPLERLKFDLYYIKNMSFRLDLFVLLKTLKLVFFPAGR